MIVQPISRAEIRGAHLRGFEARQHVLSDVIDQVCRISLIARNPTGQQILSSIAFLAPIDVEGHALGCDPGQLCPSPRSGYGDRPLVTEYCKALPQSTDSSGI